MRVVLTIELLAVVEPTQEELTTAQWSSNILATLQEEGVAVALADGALIAGHVITVSIKE